MKYIVTGAAGFIGSNLVDRLINDGHCVLGIDNLSTGRIEFLKKSLASERFTFLEGDITNKEFLEASFKGWDFVYHLAANADVRFGLNHPYKDIEQNTIGTFNVLEAMRANNIFKIGFSSTGSVYGESSQIPTLENAPFPIQTSLYGSSKLSGEALITSYCEGYKFEANIFRFVGILGERYTHGHIYDFYQKLKRDPSQLEILGDGKQRKSYLYVQDCVEAILMAEEKMIDNINIYNLGVNSYCEVMDSVKIICNELKISPKLRFTGGERGWVGDNPFIFLETSKIRSLGWTPKLSIQEGVIKTINYLRKNEWVFKANGE
ncbi:MAG: NAD-dependent epimerase/dehydratase family protein [Kordiimonadaceae bacterium]|nr:NAD-dependent epimerase/dehydratase family protein [Kordiimonadaceae bacterium]